MKFRLCMALLVLTTLLAQGRAEKPNIILVLIDDVGTGWIPPYADRLQPEDIEPELLAIYAQKRNEGRPVDAQKHIEAARKCMPFLSKLAAEGAVFDRCFATAALCAPSRAGLLTGTFQQRWGAYWNDDIDDHGIPADRVVMAEPLQAAGYRCGIVGKWHVAKKDPAIINRVWVKELGQKLPIPQYYNGLWPQLRAKLKDSGWQSSCAPGQHPLDRGFDYYFGYNSHDSKYFKATELWENHQRVPPRPAREFLTDLLNEKSCAFIDEALSDGTPFFLYYAPMTLHGGIVRPPHEYVAPFDIDIGFSDTYAGHLMALDAGLRQIFQTLEKHGAAKNTLFLLSADNGCTLYYVPPHNAPNRGGKGTGWLGGLNVPLIAWMPGVVKPGINREITSLADLLPTVLEAAGATVPEGIDGKSLLPFLTGRTPQGPRKSLGSAGIQSSRWSYCYEANGENNAQDARECPMYAWYLEGDRMLMHTTPVKPGLYSALPNGHPAQTQLFDIGTDRQQRINLADQFPEQARQFDQQIHDWLGGMAPPLTSQPQDYRELLDATK